MQLRHTLQ